jgi:hypothetical protein
VIWEDLVDARTVELTANDNTIYNFIWIDTKWGPLVIEIPPKVLGGVNESWYRWVADVGTTGEDLGKGGKYIVLPPGYSGDVPAGFVVLSSSTFGNWLFFRVLLVEDSTTWRRALQGASQHLSLIRRRQSPAIRAERRRTGLRVSGLTEVRAQKPTYLEPSEFSIRKMYARRLKS